MQQKINKLIKKSLHSKTLLQDIYCYILMKIHYGSKYTVGLLSMDRTYYKLEKKYSKFLKEINIIDTKEHIKTNYVWIFWFQGIENAPELVKKCYESVKKNLKDRDIILITKDNYNNYVDIPEIIVNKFNNGIISLTHFSDILRLALLVKYGGLWLDATVYCTGNNIEYLYENDLFVYRNGWMDMETINMASWLIYAKTNNAILNETLQLLYKYWSENNYMCNYFLFHMFFRMVTNKHYNEWSKVPYVNHIDNHLLAKELLNKYDLERFKNIKSLTNFHKLSYKISIKELSTKDTFYEKIIRDELK